MPDSTFDPISDKNQGLCADCKTPLVTEADIEAHINETLAASKEHRSHTVRHVNPSREDRIQIHIDDIFVDALRGVTSQIGQLVQRGKITSEEAETAVSPWTDLANEWRDINADPQITTKE